MRVKREIEKNPGNIHLHKQLKEHEKWLLKVGNDTVKSYGKIDHGDNIIEVPGNMVCASSNDVKEKVFEDFQDHIGEKKHLSERILLAATNEYVDRINDNLVEEISGEPKEFNSVDTVHEDDCQTMYPQEWLNKQSISGLPQHQLKLKENTVVMLMRNMNIKAGHCNGTRYIVKRMGEYR